ncbi:MAG: DUF2849 domain-containing protein [Hyphomicrobiales bacterium]|nr:DUF2849 domain-containing protein [Hyphomicrobiales bacterium]
MAQHHNQTAQTLAVTANRLLDGEVVYFTAGGSWSEHFGDAAVVHNKDDGEALLQKAMPSVEALEIIGPYLFEVRELGDGAAPVSVRENIRMKGPTVRLDLGKQAERPRV